MDGADKPGIAAPDQRRIALLALAANAAIAAAKFAASLATGSSAMLAEAVHSLVDASSQALLMLGLTRAGAAPAAPPRAGQAAGELHFWGFVVAILLYSMGAGVALTDGADKLAHPATLKDHQFSYLVLGIALIIQIGVVWYALGRFKPQQGTRPLLTALRASKNPSIFIIVLEAMAAIAGTLAAGAGIALVDLQSLAQADGGAALVIGLVLGLVAAVCAIEVKGVLMSGVATAAPAQGSNVNPRAEEPAGRILPAATPAAANQSAVAASIAEQPVAAPAGKPQLAPKQPANHGSRKKRRNKRR